MTCSRWTSFVQAVALLSISGVDCSAQQPFSAIPQSLVTHLYDLVTFEAGTTPDWTQVRALFIDEAVIVLRTSRDSSTVFSVDGFIQDFMSFIEQANVEQTGFVERIVQMKPLVFRDIAHVLVLYEASIPGSPRPPQKGVDSFQLIRRNGRWWIVSVTNDLPDADHPAPAELPS